MEWWQVGLIILGAVVGGILTGVLVSYLIRRFAKKPEVTPVPEEQWKSAVSDLFTDVEEPFVKPETTSVVEEQRKSTVSDLFTEVEKLFVKSEATSVAEVRVKKEAELVVREKAKREAGEVKVAKEAEVEEQLKFTAADLLAEVKNNHRLATAPLTDKLLPFQTDAWAAHQYEIEKLPAKLRDNLKEVYTDIRLANSIVWVSAEFNRRTASLDEHYGQLCTSIAKRLDKIEPLIERLGK